MKFKVGDFVRLRPDLIDGEIYSNNTYEDPRRNLGNTYIKSMYFDNIKQVKLVIDEDHIFLEGVRLSYTEAMIYRIDPKSFYNISIEPFEFNMILDSLEYLTHYYSDEIDFHRSNNTDSKHYLTQLERFEREQNILKELIEELRRYQKDYDPKRDDENVGCIYSRYRG